MANEAIASIGPDIQPHPRKFVAETPVGFIEQIGDFTVFCLSVFSQCFTRPMRGSMVPIFYEVGVRSLPVVALTGLFIGMVLAVQAYAEFARLGMATSLGMMVNKSVVVELGPVLAASMLAGRVGGAMAAELATMKISEQLDALICLGASPVKYLAVPRFLACLFMIPVLTTLANFCGIVGGALVTTQLYGVDPHHYWENTKNHIFFWDVGVGLVKPMVFGGIIALIACHQGFNSGKGATGVGAASTVSFVCSFIAILVFDFFLSFFANRLQGVLWPG